MSETKIAELPEATRAAMRRYDEATKLDKKARGQRLELTRDRVAFRAEGLREQARRDAPGVALALSEIASHPEFAELRAHLRPILVRLLSEAT